MLAAIVESARASAGRLDSDAADHAPLRDGIHELIFTLLVDAAYVFNVGRNCRATSNAPAFRHFYADPFGSIDGFHQVLSPWASSGVVCRIGIIPWQRLISIDYQHHFAEFFFFCCHFHHLLRHLPSEANVRLVN